MQKATEIRTNLPLLHRFVLIKHSCNSSSPFSPSQFAADVKKQKKLSSFCFVFFTSDWSRMSVHLSPWQLGKRLSLSKWIISRSRITFNWLFPETFPSFRCTEKKWHVKREVEFEIWIVFKPNRSSPFILNPIPVQNVSLRNLQVAPEFNWDAFKLFLTLS